MLSALTDEQRAVVIHGDGPAVVIACPGSGKTQVLTHRIAHLVQTRAVQPAEILGITFTRSAAHEMKERLATLLGAETARQVRLFTFHGLAWRILRDVDQVPKIMEVHQQHEMIGQILRAQEVNADQTAVDSMLTDIACFVGGQIQRSQFQPVALDPDLFFTMWDEYTRLKFDAGLADFDDLLIQARDVLINHPTYCADQVQRIRHLLVDEFQDTNALQWQLMRLLIPPSQNLMVVGDDDQAIYGWRGASPSFMLTFPQEFPRTQQFYLSHNFRSARSIFDPAERLIRVNTVRFAKKLQADRPAVQTPVLSRPNNSAAEAELIAEWLRSYLSAGGNPAEAAVLYRTGMTAFPLHNRLEKAGVPFRILGNHPHPFNRWMVRDVLTYIRWSLGIASTEEILRVLRRPTRWGISKELVVQVEQEVTASADVLPWLEHASSPPGVRELGILVGQLSKLRALPAPEAISYIRAEIGYDRYIDQYCQWSGSEPREAKEVLAALEQIPEQFDTVQVYLDLAARVEQNQDQPDDDTPRVTLSTLHGAKGLEWEHVWIISAVEGAIPHRTTIDRGTAASLEEERRLFYVGMTRAKDALHLSAPRVMFGADATVSRFIVEAGIWSPPPPTPSAKRGGNESQTLPPPLAPDYYVAGSVCWHAKFDEGVIQRVDLQAGLVEVKFTSIDGTKVLSLDHCLSRQILRIPPDKH